MTGAQFGGDRSARGVSTVLDVAVCLLFVSAAVGVVGIHLAGDDEPTVDPDAADRTVELLGSTTVTVQYSFDPAFDHAPADAFDDPDAYSDGERSRVTHGPSAAMLADATQSNLSLEGERISHDGIGFERAIEGPLVDELFVVDESVAITAHWTPYEDAPLEGTATIGPTPPPAADVSSVTMSVPSGFEAHTASPSEDDGSDDSYHRNPDDRGDGTESRVDSDPDSEPEPTYEGLATSIATATVEGTFPLEETTLALERGGLERDRTVYRYTALANALDDAAADDLEDPLAQDSVDVEAANAKLIESMTTQLAADMADRFDSPADAADTVDVETITITVQVWNP